MVSLTLIMMVVEIMSGNLSARVGPQVLGAMSRTCHAMPLNLTSYFHSRSVPSFTNILLVSTLLRIGLILYSEWHDAHSVVKYTDIDYRVFSDAARFVLHPVDGNRAQGFLGERLAIGEYVLRPLCHLIAL